MAEHVALKKILGTEQRGCLHHAEGHAGRALAGDPRREGSEVGGGAKAAANSSAAGCMIRFGAAVREAGISLPLIGRTPLASSTTRRYTATWTTFLRGAPLRYSLVATTKDRLEARSTAREVVISA